MINKYLNIKSDNHFLVSIPLCCGRLNPKIDDRKYISLLENIVRLYKGYSYTKFLRDLRNSIRIGKLEYKLIVCDENGVRESKWGLIH